MVMSMDVPVVQAPAHAPRVFVVSGPSGVGKGTLIGALLESANCPPRLTRCVTATTRERKPSEVEGTSYYFLTEQEFTRRVEQEWFLEWAFYNQNRYGTPREEVDRHLAAGEDVLLEIEVQGGLAVRRLLPESVLVFVMPPSWQELERRLRARARDSAEEIERRLRTARDELGKLTMYDYCVINDEVERGVDVLRAIVLAERARLKRAGEPCRGQ